MEIRDATGPDQENVIALWGEAGLVRPWNPPAHDFQRALAAPNAAILLGFEQSFLVASVMLGFDGHRGWIYYLATKPDKQRAGRGKRILAAAEARLKQLGAPKAELMVREGNDAIGFYEHLGWDRQEVTVFARWLNGDK